MLAGDDIFIRGIRRGIETGDYVYRRGELLYGPGDPAASIQIDEQSVIFTMAYAREHGIWPRPEKVTPTDTYPTDLDTGAATGTSGGLTARNGGTVDTEIGKQPGSFTAEGVLKEALTRLWEQVRARKLDTISRLTIRLFEAGDAFRLLGAIGAVPGATKTVHFEGGYETPDGGTLQIEFQGSAGDAQPVKEFLDAQMRAAKDKNLATAFELQFESGLPMNGDAPEKLSERLARFASGAAYVSATAAI